MSTKPTPPKPNQDLPSRAGAAVPPVEEPPPIQEYPKMLYHEDGSTRTVATKEDEAAAKKDGYQDTPVGPPAEGREKRRD